MALPEDMFFYREKIARWVPDDELSSLNTAMGFELPPRAGLIWATNVRVGRSATVHVVIWGKEWLGRADAIAQEARRLFDFFQLKRMDAYIPVTNTLACRFVERLGFRFEGVLRKACKWREELVDLAAYSILKEDYNG